MWISISESPSNVGDLEGLFKLEGPPMCSSSESSSSMSESLFRYQALRIGRAPDNGSIVVGVAVSKFLLNVTSCDIYEPFCFQLLVQSR